MGDSSGVLLSDRAFSPPWSDFAHRGSRAYVGESLCARRWNHTMGHSARGATRNVQENDLRCWTGVHRCTAFSHRCQGTYRDVVADVSHAPGGSKPMIDTGARELLKVTSFVVRPSSGDFDVLLLKHKFA